MPHIAALAVKLIKLPLSFAAGERSFLIAAHIQTDFRTRLSYGRLHKLLYIYYNSRALPGSPTSSPLPEVRRCDAGTGGSSALRSDGAGIGEAESGEEDNLQTTARRLARSVAEELLVPASSY